MERTGIEISNRIMRSDRWIKSDPDPIMINNELDLYEKQHKGFAKSFSKLMDQVRMPQPPDKVHQDKLFVLHG